MAALSAERLTLSVVIPCLNEAERLPLLLADLQRWPLSLEITLVDGGSNDHSQCQAPGNEAGSNGGMLCDVECTDRCPDFLCTFPLKTSSRSWFPIERFPNNSESQGYTSQRYE